MTRRQLERHPVWAYLVAILAGLGLGRDIARDDMLRDGPPAPPPRRAGLYGAATGGWSDPHDVRR